MGDEKLEEMIEIELPAERSSWVRSENEYNTKRFAPSCHIFFCRQLFKIGGRRHTLLDDFYSTEEHREESDAGLLEYSQCPESLSIQGASYPGPGNISDIVSFHEHSQYTTDKS